MNHQPVDMSAPAYQEGQAMAHLLLDSGPLTADDLLIAADEAAAQAQQTENTPGYLRSRGMGDTIRDYLTERAD